MTTTDPLVPASTAVPIDPAAVIPDPNPVPDPAPVIPDPNPNPEPAPVIPDPNPT